MDPPTSMRDLIALRRAHRDLTAGRYATLATPAGAWAHRRGDRFAVAVNLSDADVTVGGLDGRVAIGSDRARDGAAVDGSLGLGPWDGVVVRLSGLSGDDR